jgi:hypothetical protein
MPQSLIDDPGLTEIGRPLAAFVEKLEYGPRADRPYWGLMFAA